jgi:hypothetical protein
VSPGRPEPWLPIREWPHTGLDLRQATRDEYHYATNFALLSASTDKARPGLIRIKYWPLARSLAGDLTAETLMT